MSKSVGRIFGVGSISPYGYETDYMNYLRGYDTSNYDNTLKNMTVSAYDMSGKLNAMPEYQFGVDYSDAARQRAEDATYNSYVDKLNPLYQQQLDDMQTRLVNQGIPVGSEAYNRAMGEVQNSMNDALNQAAYQSVLAGQDMYSQSLADSISAAGFSNNARQSYIDQIKSLLEGSVSGYDNAMNLYNIQSGVQARRNASQQSGWDNMFRLASLASLLKSGKSDNQNG
ncbi:MAG: hypothetical protein IJ532_05440 [Alphaproteobacteria bacterium]|nr:hypothetical protein [Alphaproteobacteria bacterium]